MKHTHDSGLVITTAKGTPEEASDMALARRCGAVLNQHYAGHPWVIDVQGGVIMVRHLELTLVAAAALRREGFGFMIKPGAKDIGKAAVEAGGAMLELFKLPRGPWTGQLPEVPEHWVPKMSKGFA